MSNPSKYETVARAHGWNWDEGGPHFYRNRPGASSLEPYEYAHIKNGSWKKLCEAENINADITPKFNHVCSVGFTVISNTIDGKDFTPDLLKEALLRRIRDMDDSPKGSEWLEAVGGPEDTYEEPEEAKPRVYTFNLKVIASVNVTATSEAEAIAMIENEHFETANLGAFDDGTPIIADIDDIEDSSGGPLGAVKVDGEEI